MTDQPSEPRESHETDAEGMPRWVKVFGIVLIVGVLVVVVLHLTGRGFGGHG